MPIISVQSMTDLIAVGLLPQRIAAWVALALGLALWVRRAGQGRAGDRPVRAVLGLAAAVLAAAFILERWPGPRTSVRFPDAVEAGPGATVFIEDARVEGDRAWVDAGRHRLLVRTRDEAAILRLRVEGEGLLRVRGRAPLVVTPAGLDADVPLQRVATLEGRRGVKETLWREDVELEAPGPLALRASIAPALR